LKLDRNLDLKLSLDQHKLGCQLLLSVGLEMEVKSESIECAIYFHCVMKITKLLIYFAGRLLLNVTLTESLSWRRSRNVSQTVTMLWYLQHLFPRNEKHNMTTDKIVGVGG